MTEQQREAADRLGWFVKEYDDEWLVENHSPAGEDLPIEIPKSEDAARWIRQVAETFDPDENVELWIDKRGQDGVPSTARELVEDADAIKKIYEELADAVEAA